MRLLLVLGLCTLVASCGAWRGAERGLPAPVAAAPGSAVFSTSSGVQALNGFRADNGLGPLVVSPALEKAARAHARDMARRGFFDHSGSDGSTVMDRARRAGYSPCYIAENIARGQRSLAEVMDGWATSPGHRRNMLSANATEFGLVRGEGDIWVMVLGRAC
ncbi:CAP domain-containing protein [Maliponia aquimaris]|uniref:Cysteine-rich secretory protein family protein n=1 Tax=Maliponia aquimaris TaxID=1673631 RepID=A0A238KK56_9RHOB|nr:CAP domain-containing protein [Maliponia aquimaris]SMX43219.1 Cysteine-rich secretory protein family protein [Maliponia aquimaris]